ncbi:hypothetical protein GCM10011415_24440 [Salipiger pallidus]|uniref:Uncharacterized protein n=1 Tax=Salipiger pallidus TaxID=1775170 RepID=A0A8J2ZKR5_9RHOB|nr:hypothetical protein [Salipiger pallidus]GGG75017.1 hypothetical protein GCM10011415_24440 [Salipiger pallidus]
MHLVLVAILMVFCPAASADQATYDRLSLRELLDMDGAIARELHDRGVIRSGNMTGDLAEHIFATAHGWDLAARSQKGFDATDGNLRIQVKSRRVRSNASGYQLGAIRDLDSFDRLAVVIFDPGYRIRLAAILPADLVRREADFNAYTNSYRLIFRHHLLSQDGVEDVTETLRAVY